MNKKAELFNNLLENVINVDKQLSIYEYNLDKILFRKSEEVYSMVTKGEYKNSFTYFMNRIFPKWDVMKHAFPFLKKAPILLPFMYVYRILRLLVSPKKIKNNNR